MGENGELEELEKVVVNGVVSYEAEIEIGEKETKGLAQNNPLDSKLPSVQFSYCRYLSSIFCLFWLRDESSR